jgi:ATP-dependent DNA helicase RecQ
MEFDYDDYAYEEAEWVGELSPGKISVAAPLVPALDQGLSTLFGFNSFRPGQRDVMEATLSGLNSLVVMPTGSGKSLCYQLPACVLDGITIVVSPLIALMKDQVDALLERDIPATFINSSLSAKEQRERLSQVCSGEIKLLYVAPERFRNQGFCSAISRVKIGLFAIDEAHCISQWGHDFRPDYLRLAEVHRTLGAPTTIALTATATKQVQQDILEQLQLDKAGVFVYGFERPNLFLEVFDARSKQDKLDRMRALITHVQEEGTSLIYCATRKQVEEVADELLGMGLRASAYHAGLSDNERARIQDEFMAGHVPILVATNAFGMGVDKSDIRATIHYNMPGSLEAYYQEAGRAGRDGLPSHCLLLFNYADRQIHEFFIEQTYPTPATVERVWDMLRRLGLGTHAISADQITRDLNRDSSHNRRLNSWGVESAMRILQRAGVLEFGTRDGFPWCTIHQDLPPRSLKVDWDYIHERRGVIQDLLTDVVRYASSRDCRQLALLRYFNSTPSFQGGCGHCDVCKQELDYMRGQATPGPTITLRTSDEPLLIAQKLLSGVARARGRFGAHIIAGMLRGSNSQKVTRANLDRLSTFGLLSYIKQPDIVTLLDLCLRLDLLARDEHGCLSITQEGVAVMRAESPLPPALDHLLTQATAHQRRSPSPARSSSSSTTRTSTAPPTTSSVNPTNSTKDSDSTDSTYITTLLLLQEGKDLQQIATARNFTLQTVLRHLLVLADAGEQLVLDQWIDPDLMDRVRTHAAAWKYGDPLADLKQACDPCAYDALKLHLAQLLLERHGHG